MAEKPIEQKAQDFYDAVFDKELIALMDVAEGKSKPTKRLQESYDFGEYPEDVARQIISEQRYDIDSEIVYYVTLAGGGPAARLRVTVDNSGNVESAVLQCQDWFTYWTDAPNQDRELVERYATLLADYYGD